MTKLMIEINGKGFEVTNINDYGWPMIDVIYGIQIIELSDGTEWYIFQDSESAGEEARKYWEDLAQDDPKEFACVVGEDTLVKWALKQYAGPGSTQVQSLDEWLDLWLDTPEEQWASYDGTEVDCRISRTLQEELGLESPCVCYRHN